MPQLTVRDVPEEVVRCLREEAQRQGRSINALVKAALAEHVERRRHQRRLQERLAAMEALRERIRERHGGNLSSSVPLIREDRR